MANQNSSESFPLEPTEIPLEKIFLDLKNPRHPAYKSEEEVISYLCKNEYVTELAQDIVNMGINPLELLAVIKNPDNKTYFAAEGNRRLCALKLLDDPQLAPKEQRKDFKALNRRWQSYNTVRAIVFEDRDSVAHWLERTHGGLQGGIGRKQWDAEQKTRFTGAVKNLMAQQLLDYAQSEEMISTDQRAKKISIVQRFISNPVFKDALGIDTGDNKVLRILRVKDDFDIILSKFIEDIISNKVNTRKNAEQIRSYAKKLRELSGLTNTSTPPTPFNVLSGKTGSIPKSGAKTDSTAITPVDGENPAQSSGGKPKPTRRPRFLGNAQSTEAALKKLNNYKLDSLYNSLCTLLVADHCPLLTIGLWSFVESLTALCGRSQGTDFQAFLSTEKLAIWGLGNNKDTKPLRECLRRLSENGNSSKHDKNSATFNDQQLINDFSTLMPLIQKLIQCAHTSAEEKN